MYRLNDYVNSQRGNNLYLEYKRYNLYGIFVSVDHYFLYSNRRGGYMFCSNYFNYNCNGFAYCNDFAKLFKYLYWRPGYIERRRGSNVYLDSGAFCWSNLCGEPGQHYYLY